MPRLVLLLLLVCALLVTRVAAQRELQFFYNQEYRARDLWDAIEEEDETAFATILDCGCINLEETDPSGSTALLLAVRKESFNMSRDLISAGADVNAQDSIGLGPLHVSCFQHTMEITILLLEHGAEVNLRTVDNERPIIHAQTQDDLPLMELLVRSGAEINFQDAQGESPLHEAAAYGASQNAEFLINRGANLTVENLQGNTPAEFICACRDFDERRAAPCFDGTCTDRDIALLQRIFRRATNRLSASEDDQITIEDLWIAVVNGTLEEVNEILDVEGIEIQAVTQTATADWAQGQTALHLAVVEGRLPVCRALLRAGARAGVHDAVGNTPLHLATLSNSVPIVELLLQQEEVILDAQNEAGETALHIATQNGYITISGLLVEQGASITIHDEEGTTAVELLCSCQLGDRCPEGSCRNASDIGDLMEALNQHDPDRETEFTDLYFQNNVSVNSDTIDRLPDEDDGASALGLFVGMLFLCAFVFFVIYGAIICYVRRTPNPQLTQRMNQPGPSNGRPAPAVQ